jgi:uncharacterized protein
MSAHVPERTCVGCRERAPKAGLLRLTVVEGRMRPDAAASSPGRGAYLHRDRACVEAALARGALARALRTSLDEHGAATLRTEIEGELER